MAKKRLQQATTTATATEVERVKENARLDMERLELENKKLRIDTENAINKVRLLEDDVERLELENKKFQCFLKRAFARK